MLYRKIERILNERFESKNDKISVVVGARQIGKSYIVRYCGNLHFRNVIEINLVEDKQGPKIFESVRTTEDFYFALSAYSGVQLGNVSDTLIFLDEIQEYPQLLTLLKFLRQEGRYRYVASGSLLGVTLKRSASVPLGSIEIVPMYPLDFEEFLYATGFGKDAYESLKRHFESRDSLPDGIHEHVMNLYKRFLLVGGLPEAVNEYLDSHDLVKVRQVQRSIMELYKVDAAKYDELHSLKIKRMYELIPSNMENKKKRVVYKDIEGMRGKRASDYEDEMEYLISSGIALEVTAVSNPKFPLIETEHKNLMKLYLNDPGLLTLTLYGNNPMPVLNTECGINLGSVYECAVACQLKANGNILFYYDNRKTGEVDFLFDDFRSLSVVPLEVKSGKDYKRHVALSRFLLTEDYGIREGYVLSNSRAVEEKNGVVYIPVYFSMFFDNRLESTGPVII